MMRRMNYHYLLFIPLAIAGLAVGCAAPDQSQEAIDARWQKRNVRAQLVTVPNFQEVWYKGHLYIVTSMEGSRKGMLAHAGHCPGIHVTRIGGESQL